MSDYVPVEGGRIHAPPVDNEKPPPSATNPRVGGLVFISHEKNDEGLAREIRAHLETGGLSCWMAPDDIRGPTPWPQQVEQAIATCDVMLVVVSANSGSSHHVSREVDLAVEMGRPLLPVRVEDVAPTGTLNYLLRLSQWIDLFPGSIADHAGALQGTVASMLEQRGIAAPTTPAQRRARWRVHIPKSMWFVLAAVALVAAGVGIGIRIGAGPSGDDVVTESPAEEPSDVTQAILSEEAAPTTRAATEAPVTEAVDNAPPSPTTGIATATRISVATDGTQGNDHSVYPSISADGRYVTFYSRSTNLVEGDGTAPEGMDPHDVPDVFVHDRETGETTRISQVVFGERVEPGDDGSRRPQISGNGRYVVYESGAGNLDPQYGLAPVGTMYLHDRETGTNRAISFNPNGGQHPGSSHDAAISADGTLIAYGMRAHPSGHYSVFVHDTTTDTTIRLAEFQGVDQRFVAPPSVTPDGSYVWVGAGNFGTFFFERETASVTAIAQLEGIEVSNMVAFPDGQAIAFTSGTPSLVPNDVNEADDAFIYNRATHEFTLLLEFTSDRSALPSSVSADGRYIAMAGQVNLIIDLLDGSIEELSSSLGLSRLMLSGDGKWATFSTSAALVSDDTNGHQDVYVIQLLD